MADPPGMRSPRPPRRPRVSPGPAEERLRRRYVDAVAELLHEFGRCGLSVTAIVARAGTSRSGFYEVFSGVEDCIAHGVELAAGEIFAALAAQDGEGEWSAELEAAVAGFYEAVAAAPLHAELLLVHSRICKSERGRGALARRVAALAALLERGRAAAEARGLLALPEITGEFLARGVVFVATQRVREEKTRALAAESPEVAALVESYYLG